MSKHVINQKNLLVMRQVPESGGDRVHYRVARRHMPVDATTSAYVLVWMNGFLKEVMIERETDGSGRVSILYKD